ncbi:MAG: catalase [Clostridiales bacterium]|nr:catalase [Clostridiales bacterium]
MKAWQHFLTITEHKWLVMKFCFSVGLYKQGLLHDMSKYSPTEFLVGAQYFQGNRSPNNAEREEKGYSSSWLHHKGRNKHHFEYWIDYSGKKELGLVGMRMPIKYVIEMFMDRVAACKIYQRENYNPTKPLEYYEKGYAAAYLHKDTARMLRFLLKKLADEGEQSAFSYARKMLYVETIRERNREIERKKRLKAQGKRNTHKIRQLTDSIKSKQRAL